MNQRKIQFHMIESGELDIAVPQYAGVKGEHNATIVSFVMTTAYTADINAVRMSFRGGDGTVLSTDLLTPFTADGHTGVSYALPATVTQLGGQVEVRLVFAHIDENGDETEVFCSHAAVLYFEDAVLENGTPFWTGVSQMLKSTVKASEDARAARDAAQAIANGITVPENAVGKSAYEIAVEQGFEGDEAAWLASLKGEDGDKGDAYVLTDADKADIADDVVQKVPLVKAAEAPIFVKSIAEMTDTSKVYVLDGHFYAYMNTSTSGVITQEVKTTYTDGYRLSVSDGSAKTLAGATVTDFIDISHVSAPLTLTLSGIQWGAASQNQACAIVGYNADKTMVSKCYLIVPYTNSTEGVAISGETTNVTVALNADWLEGCAYLRICGSGTGANASIALSYAGVTQGYAWTDTGIAYTATVYTDVIGVVGENNAIYLSAHNLPRGTYTLKYGDETYDTVGTITVE